MHSRNKNRNNFVKNLLTNAEPPLNYYLKDNNKKIFQKNDKLKFWVTFLEMEKILAKIKLVYNFYKIYII